MTRVVEKVKTQLSRAQWISFTTDIWSNPTKSCSLLTFTGHFLDGPVRHKIILGAMVLKEDHTAVHFTFGLLSVSAESKVSTFGRPLEDKFRAYLLLDIHSHQHWRHTSMICTWRMMPITH